MTTWASPADGPSTSVGAGTRLANRYELRRPLASGGMAQVWLAHDTVLDRLVAAKILHPHLGTDAGFVERFRREAVAAARLSHPSIVAIYDTISGGGVEAIVMELIDGRTLRALLDETGALPVGQVIHIGISIASALDDAHRAGIVHRDIKPANIMMANDGRALVTDFGIAKAGTDSDLTATGTLIGTAKYLAPEQVTGDLVDPRSDLYSLGIVLFESLAGVPPFRADTDAATALARLHQEPPPLRALRPNVPPELEAIVAKLTARWPPDRFPRASALQEALTRLRANLPGGFDTGTTGGPSILTATEAAVVTGGNGHGAAAGDSGLATEPYDPFAGAPVGPPADRTTSGSTDGPPTEAFDPLATAPSPGPDPLTPRSGPRPDPSAAAPGPEPDPLRHQPPVPPAGTVVGPAVEGSPAPPAAPLPTPPEPARPVSGPLPAAPPVGPPSATGGPAATAPAAGSTAVLDLPPGPVGPDPGGTGPMPGFPPPGPGPWGGPQPPTTTPPAAAAPARRWRYAVLAVLVVVAFAIGVLATVGRDPDPGTRTPDTTAAPIAIASAVSFDPLANEARKDENPKLVPLAFDGDPKTAWPTATYKGAHFAGLKDGVGLIFDLGQTATLNRMDLTTNTEGWSAQIFVSDSDFGDDPASWGDPVATVATGGPSGQVALGGAQGSKVLLWLTETGQSNGKFRFELAEIALR